MSTVGTIPDNEDKRPPDIIADRQINRAATDPGTFAETPPPRLPQLPVYIPPNIEDTVRDIALSTFRDQAKTITINGQSPEVNGAKISFEIPTQPPASAQFAQLNPVPQPPVVPIVQPPTTGSVTTLQEMEAASAARNAPKTSAARNEEEMDARTARRIQADPEYKPSALASKEEKESYDRVTNAATSANPSGYTPPAITPQLQAQLVASVTPGATGVNWLETKGTSDWDSSKNQPKFGQEKNRLPGESRSEQEDREQKEYQQQKKEFKEKVKAIEEDQPGKRSGEGDKKYTERTNDARLEVMNKEQAAAVQNGDSSYFYKGFIPILFTRKDGERKILARLDNTHSAVIEGAVGNERQGTLPPDDGYYIAGGDTPPHPWKVTLKKEGNTYQGKIEVGSKVYKNVGTFSSYTVTGLDTWTNLQTGFVTLKATVVDAEINNDTFEIEWGVSAPERASWDGSTNEQNFVSAIIAYVYQDGDAWKLRQDAHSPFTSLHGCVDGKATIFLVQS